jgi:phosphoenolpyruvate carboxykinase (GTP)
MRLLKWVGERARGRACARETPIGWQPRFEDIDWTGSDFTPEQFAALQAVDRAAWRAEVIGHEELFIDLHAHLPKEMIFERELLICRL